MILALVAEQLVGPMGLRLEKYRSRVAAKIAVRYRRKSDTIRNFGSPLS